MDFGQNSYIKLTFNQDGTVRCQEYVYGEWQEDATYNYIYVDGVMYWTYPDGSKRWTFEVISLSNDKLVLKDWPDLGVNTFIKQ